MFRVARVTLVTLVVHLVACAAPPAAVVPTPQAASALHAAEEAWLAHPPMTVHMTASSTGAVVTELAGDATLGGEGQASLDFTGNFRGKPERLTFTITGTQLAATGAHPFTMEGPPAAERNLRLVLFRLGLLHNLAMLTAGEPPDGLDDAEAMVKLTDVSLTSENGRPTYRYTILVGGEKVGEGTLAVDPATALPLDRRLTVHFPNGDMQVHETYTLVR